MIAIDEGTVLRATKTRSIALDSAQGRSHADEEFDIPLDGECDRGLCRPGCFDIAETRCAQALQTEYSGQPGVRDLCASVSAVYRVARTVCGVPVQRVMYVDWWRQDGAGPGGVVQFRAGQICRPARQLHVAGRTV